MMNLTQKGTPCAGSTTRYAPKVTKRVSLRVLSSKAHPPEMTRELESQRYSKLFGSYGARGSQPSFYSHLGASSPLLGRELGREG